MGEFFESVWWLLILIGVMIIIHELGHYWAARFFDVRVETFSFGFGPRLFGFKKGETDFRFAAILLGGYVKMAGEQPGEDGAADPRGFLAKPRWQRLIIAFAGPFMNIVLAVGILTGLYMVHYPQPPIKPNPVVGALAPEGPAAKAGIKVGDRVIAVGSIENPTWKDVLLQQFDATNKTLSVTVLRDEKEKLKFEFALPEDDRTHMGDAGWDQQRDVLIGGMTADSPAMAAGLHEGDHLKSINGRAILSPSALVEAVQATQGKPSPVVYIRNGKEASATVTPVWRKLEEGRPERWALGIQTDVAMEITQLSFPAALKASIADNVETAGLIYKLLRGMLERRLSPRSVAGPVGIAREAKKAARSGILSYFLLMAGVSLNLAIFNLLPIPILDGGTILMLLIEMVRRQDLSLSVKETVFKFGLAFLMTLVVFVLYNDISKVRSDMRGETVPPASRAPSPAPVAPPVAPAK